jgi:S1-C subfamily serine protease
MRKTLGAFWLGLFFLAPVVADDKVSLGLTVGVALDLSFNPTVQSAKVTRVDPGSPAALGGLQPGDIILELDGIKVAGTKSDVLKAAMRKSPGETLRLTIKRGNAEPREVSLVAGTRVDRGDRK